MLAFHLVENQPTDLAQVAVQKPFIKGGGIQRDPHSLMSCRLDCVVNIGNFILQKQYVTAVKIGDYLIDVFCGHAGVGTAVNHDAVLPLFIHLDNGVSGGLIDLLQETDIHTGVAKHGTEHLAVSSDTAGMIDLRAGFGEGDGLIQSLASAESFPAGGFYGFAGCNNVIHQVGDIHVQRTQIQYFHVIPPTK